MATRAPYDAGHSQHRLLPITGIMTSDLTTDVRVRAPRMPGDARVLATWLAGIPAGTVCWILVCLMTGMTTGANGSPIWWSGLFPALVFGTAAVLWSGNARVSRLRLGTPDALFPILLCLFATAALASLCVNETSVDGAVYYASAFLSPIPIYLAVLAHLTNARRGHVLLAVIALASLVPMLSGLVAYFEAWGIPSGAEFLLSRYDLVRMAGYMHATYGNTSNTAAYLSVLLPMLLSAIWLRDVARPMRWLFVLATAACVLNALIVQSRTLFLVMIPAIVMIALAHRARMRGVIVAMTIALGIVVLPALSALDRLFDLTIGAVRGGTSDRSVIERFEAMEYGLRLFAENPGLGIGPGRALVENPHTSAHQFWVQHGSELGVTGGLVSVLLVLVVWLVFVRVLRETDGYCNRLRLTFLVGPATYVAYATIANAALAQSTVNAWMGLVTVGMAAAAALRAQTTDQRTELVEKLA